MHSAEEHGVDERTRNDADPLEYGLDSEERPVTFQIAMVGKDGLVVGSDQRATYGQLVDGQLKLPQRRQRKKYFISEDGSVACFGAGGAVAVDIAQRLVRDCNPMNIASKLEWEDAMLQLAGRSKATYGFADQLLVIRRDTINAFWLIERRTIGESRAIAEGHGIVTRSVEEIRNCFCTGSSVVAQFLPTHLWNAERTVAELRKLALVTLSYAATEDPSNVSAPFDIVTLDSRCIFEEKEFRQPMHNTFQAGLENLLRICDGLSS